MATRTTQNDGGWDQAGSWDVVPTKDDVTVINHDIFLEQDTSRNAYMSGTGSLDLAGNDLFHDTWMDLADITIDLNGGTLELSGSWSMVTDITFLDTAGGGKVDVLGEVTFRNCDFSGCPSTTTMIVGDNVSCAVYQTGTSTTLPHFTAWAYGGATLAAATDLDVAGFVYHPSSTGFDVNFKTINARGELSIADVAGFVGNTGTWKQGGGDLENPRTGVGIFGVLYNGQFGGVSATTGYIHCAKLVIGEGSGGVASSAGNTYRIYPVANDFIELEANAGTVAGTMELRLGDDYSQGALSGVAEIKVYPSVDGKALTMTGHWTLSGDCAVFQYGVGCSAELDTNGFNLTCADLKYGYAGRTDYGIVRLRDGVHGIESIVPVNSAGPHELHLDNATLNLVTLLDGTDFSIDANGVVIIGNGTIQGVSLAAGDVCHAWGMDDGGGNDIRVEFASRSVAQ